MLRLSSFISDVKSAVSKTSATMAWNGGAIVSSGTYIFIYTAPFAMTIDSLDYAIGSNGGSFTANIQINSVSVTGLSAIAVSATTKTNTAASSANAVAIGNTIQVIITAVTGSPMGSVLCINCTRT